MLLIYRKIFLSLKLIKNRPFFGHRDGDSDIVFNIVQQDA
jgi:hypothetical protein